MCVCVCVCVCVVNAQCVCVLVLSLSADNLGGHYEGSSNYSPTYSEWFCSIWLIDLFFKIISIIFFSPTDSGYAEPLLEHSGWLVVPSFYRVFYNRFIVRYSRRVRIPSPMIVTVIEIISMQHDHRHFHTNNRSREDVFFYGTFFLSNFRHRNWKFIDSFLRFWIMRRRCLQFGCFIINFFSFTQSVFVISKASVIS